MLHPFAQQAQEMVSFFLYLAVHFHEAHANLVYIIYQFILTESGGEQIHLEGWR